jgi:hypothetical protein
MEIYDSKNSETSSKSNSIRKEDKRSMLSKMSVGSLFKTLGIKGSHLGDNEDMRMKQEDQIEKYKAILW